MSSVRRVFISGIVTGILIATSALFAFFVMVAIYAFAQGADHTDIPPAAASPLARAIETHPAVDPIHGLPFIGDPREAIEYALSIAPMATVIYLTMLLGAVPVWFLMHSRISDMKEQITFLRQQARR